jgi:hypothetical protein
MERRALYSIIVALCLTALLVTAAVHAAPAALAGLPEAAALASPLIRFSPSSSTVAPGATFVVDVMVDNAADLGAFEFTLTFNPAVVSLQSATLGNFLGGTGRTAVALPLVQHAPGTYEFGGYTHASTRILGPNGTGTLAHLTFQAVAAGNSNLSFIAAQLTGTEWAPAPLTVVIPATNSGSVTVTAATGILGDVNADGAVNSTDALIVLSADAGFNVSMFCPMNCGDTNADGYINSTDALIVLSYDVGMTVPFPLGQPGCPSSVTQPAGCSL